MFGSLSWYGTKFIFLDQSKYLKLTHFMIRSCNRDLSFLVAQSNVRDLSVHSIHFLTCGTIISYDSLFRCGAFRLYGSIWGRCNYRLSRIIHRRWNCNTTWFSQLRGFYLLTWITLHTRYYSSTWLTLKRWEQSIRMVQCILLKLSVFMFHCHSSGTNQSYGSLRLSGYYLFHWFNPSGRHYQYFCFVQIRWYYRLFWFYQTGWDYCISGITRNYCANRELWFILLAMDLLL